MRKWWKSQGVTTKAAYIGGFFTCLTILCGGISLFVTNLNYFTSLPGEAQRKKLAPVEITSFDISEPGRLKAKYSGKDYFLITNQCWKVQNEDDSPIKGENAATVNLAFVVISRREQILIDGITLILDKYEKAPDSTQLTSYSIKRGQYGGGGGVDYIDLGEIDIFPNNKEFHPATIKSFTVQELNALGFELKATFHKPGSYSIHVEVATKDFWQTPQKLTSDVLEFNWAAATDLEKIVFRDPVNAKNIHLESCP